MSHFNTFAILTKAMYMYYAVTGWGEGDPPEYSYAINHLMNISVQQTSHFIESTWILPNVKFNPSLDYWTLDTTNNATDLVFFMWDAGPTGCEYMIMKIPDDDDDDGKPWIFIKHGKLEVVNAVTKKSAQYKASDPRVFHIGNRTFMTHWRQNGRIQEYLYAELLYDEKTDQLYIEDGSIKMKIEHEMGVRSEKNWSPFAQPFSADSKFLHMVYSIQPHRIVRLNESWQRSEGTHRVDTVALTKMRVNKTPFLWNFGPPHDAAFSYGNPHGGTPSVLIDTVHGPRYVTIFHSQGRFMSSWCLTYVMGAYLFHAKPPFAITHFSVDPIIPEALYDQKNGWAFRAIDYIVFPTGLIARNGSLLVALGRNDRSGWLVKLNIAGLVQSLYPVETEILGTNSHRL